MPKPPTTSKLPMRFKTALPEDFSTEQQKIYMQLSDSDDDDRPDRVTKVLRRTVVATAGKNAPKKGAANKGAEVAFKHDRPVDRERPLSAKVLHAVAANDSEFKV